MKIKCIEPEQIAAGDLLAFLENEAELTVKQHVAECLYCRREVRELGQIWGWVDEVMFREECPSTDDLLAYEFGLLSGEQERAIDLHKGKCRHCRQETKEVNAGIILPPPPPSWFNQWWQQGKQVVQAILQPTPQPQLSFRGNQQTRHQYQAEPYQITLRKIPPIAHEDIWRIEGQVRHTSNPIHNFTGQATLVQDNDPAQVDTLDEFGFFQFSNLPAGSYNLVFDLQELIISITPIDLP